MLGKPISASQAFAKILDDLKERYFDLLEICEGQEKEIKELKEYAEKQWDSVAEIVPCTAPCAREYEEILRRIKNLT